MNTKAIAACVSGSLLLAWGVMGALGGCSSTGAIDAADASDETTSGSSGTSGTTATDSATGEGGSSGSSGSSGAVQVEAGADAGSNPNYVSCGASDCDVGDSGSTFCCARSDGGKSCDTSAQQCSRDAGNVRFECDEAADCAGNDMCCLVQGGADGLGGAAGCQVQCNATEIHLCKTDADCGSGGACAPVSCYGGTRTFMACNKPAFCN
jgi:hypothetical protein